jgi:hypothetical protein
VYGAKLAASVGEKLYEYVVMRRPPASTRHSYVPSQLYPPPVASLSTSVSMCAGGGSMLPHWLQMQAKMALRLAAFLLKTPEAHSVLPDRGDTSTNSACSRRSVRWTFGTPGSVDDDAAAAGHMDSIAREIRASAIEV